MFYHTLVLYCKNQLQFSYHPILSEIKYSSKVLCSYRLFLYPYIFTSPIFFQLLPYKCILHCLMLVLYLPTIITFCLLHNYKIIHWNKILPCPTWIGFFILLNFSIFYSFCISLLLFDKYHQHIYKSRGTGFIYYCLYQTLIIIAHSIML